MSIAFDLQVNAEKIMYMRITALWHIAPCSLAEVDRRFRDAYYLHHPLKRRSTPTRLHVAISQKAVIFWKYVTLSDNRFSRTTASVRYLYFGLYPEDTKEREAAYQWLKSLWRHIGFHQKRWISLLTALCSWYLLQNNFCNLIDSSSLKRSKPRYAIYSLHCKIASYPTYLHRNTN
jgi:hypothetical protein